VPVLEELRHRGHEVVLRTLASELPEMHQLGFQAEAIATEIEALPMDDWRARTRLGRLKRAVTIQLERAPLDCRDLDAAIAATKPDALIVDMLALGAVSAAEAWGGPWASSCPFPLPIPSRSGPAPGFGFRPARGAIGRARDRAFESIGTAGFDRLAGSRLSEVRATVGLSPLKHARDVYSQPPLHLYMTAEPFEYPQRDWPESVLMVGPCNWEGAGEPPEGLEDVEEPLVLITTSSEFQDDGRLAEVALEALRSEELHPVATVPSAAIETLSPAVRGAALPYAPHMPVLRRSACAITHGGMGATQKALALGVPVLVVPFGRDQFEVARRVETAHAGTSLSSRRLNPRRLRAKVREAIGCRPGAERIARAFAAAGGARAAADAVERRLFA
jgi:MGT family glycosyltransferase